jgi:hypothetical protein
MLIVVGYPKAKTIVCKRIGIRRAAPVYPIMGGCPSSARVFATIEAQH